MPPFAECGGIEPPRPYYSRKPVLKTGRATRPTHSWSGAQSVLHRLPVAAGEDPYVARAAGDACGVGVLEPGLGVLATRTQAVAEFSKGDLTFLLADGLYPLQYRLGGRARGEE